MSRSKALLSGLVVLVVSLQSALAYCQSGVWHRTLADAERQAREQGKTLLIHFSGNNCGYCVQMDRRVFSSPVIQQELRRSVAAVYLNRDVDLAAAAQFGIRGVPTDIVIYPDGSSRTLVGGKSLGQFQQILAEARTHNRAPKQLQPPVSKFGDFQQAVPYRREQGKRVLPGPDTDKQNDSSLKSGPDKSQLARFESPVQPADFVEVEISAGPGLQGYCPVTLSDLRQWKRGQERYSYAYQGVTYRFCSAAARDSFRADPEKYAPEIQGCDPVTLAQQRRAVSGDVRFGVWLDGRLYLFQDAQNRQAFKQSPQLYSTVRSAAEYSADVAGRQ
ncbi:MAG TPA: hypothetical protein DCR20_12520 [Planctomycetaceae bacterium]|nr:hypothetical protein [Planctomycetaceae bacterium]